MTPVYDRLAKMEESMCRIADLQTGVTNIEGQCKDDFEDRIVSIETNANQLQGKVSRIEVESQKKIAQISHLERENKELKEQLLVFMAVCYTGFKIT